MRPSRTRRRCARGAEPDRLAVHRHAASVTVDGALARDERLGLLVAPQRRPDPCHHPGRRGRRDDVVDRLCFAGPGDGLVAAVGGDEVDQPVREFLRLLLGLAQPSSAGVEPRLPRTAIATGGHFRPAQCFATRFCSLRPRPLPLMQGLEIARRGRRCRPGRRSDPAAAPGRGRTCGKSSSRAATRSTAARIKPCCRTPLQARLEPDER